MQKMLAQERLHQAKWRFGEQGKPPWAAELSLMPDGHIGGHSNDNESTWQLVNGRLEIFNGAGEPSWRFILVDVRAGLFELEGTFLLDDSFKGTATLTELAEPKVTAAVPLNGKLAVLVMAAAAPKILDRMVQYFGTEKFCFFVHLDAKRDLEKYTAEMTNAACVTFIKQRAVIYWGGFHVVEAEIALIRAALADQAVSNVVLISDDTIALRQPDKIHAALAQAPERIASTANGWREGWYRGFFYPDSNFSSLLGDLMHELRQFRLDDLDMLLRLEQLRVRGKRALPAVHFCRPWWALSREKLERIMAFLDADEHFIESFRFSLSPDETFFATAFNLCFPDAAALEIPTFADFATVPRHPNPWIYRSAAEITGATLNANHLFIHKIAPGEPNIIDDLAKTWNESQTAIG